MKHAFIGVYSTKDKSNLRSARGGSRKRYWFVWELGDSHLQVQALNGALEPVGEISKITRRDFRRLYTPEPSILAMPLSKDNQYPSRMPSARLSANQERPDRTAPLDLRGTLPYEADTTKKSNETDKASLDLDLLDSDIFQTEHELRIRFGSALAQLKRGNREDAIRSLRTIAREEDGITPKHKHMFAEFGTNLRKSKLPEIALLHNKRVLDLDPNDGNAHFNVARIYYELGDERAAREHLKAARELSPENALILAFLDFLDTGTKIKSPAK